MCKEETIDGKRYPYSGVLVQYYTQGVGGSSVGLPRPHVWTGFDPVIILYIIKDP